MNTELKAILIKTCDLFNLMDEKLGVMNRAYAKGELCNVLKYELLAFLCCISASDGRISRIEAQLVREYLELNFYPVDIKDFIHEHDIGSEDYYARVPESLKLAVDVDNYMIGKGQKLDRGVSEIILELFRAFGKAMVVADEKVKAEEQTCWSRYITMMAQYLVDKSLIYMQRPESIPRPGTPIEVDYEMSLDKIGRIYTLYIGQIDKEQ